MILPGVVAGAQLAAAGGGGGGSYGWSPRDITNTRIIGVRADGDLVYSSGVIVSEWRDEDAPTTKFVKSGSGDITRVDAVVGGLPVLRWPSSHSIVLTGPSLSVLNGGTGGTLFMILKKRVHASASDTMSGLFHCSTFGSANHYSYTDGNNYLNFGNDRVHIGNFNTSAWHTLRCLNANGGGGIGQRFYQQNVLRFSNNTVANTFPGAMYLGHSPQSGNRYFDGDMLECWVWDGQLSGGDVTLLEQYGADRISGAWLAAGGDGP